MNHEGTKITKESRVFLGRSRSPFPQMQNIARIGVVGKELQVSSTGLHYSSSSWCSS
jgi:hypothetical protein